MFTGHDARGGAWRPTDRYHQQVRFRSPTRVIGDFVSAENNESSAAFVDDA